MRRLMSRRRMVRDAMGFPSVRQGLMTALLAAFIVFFGMTSVDAMACERPTAPAETATLVMATAATAHPAESRPDDTRPCGPFCAYCQCHHFAVAAVDAPAPPSLIPVRSPSNRVAAAESFVSRTPSGPDRPPQG